MAAVVFPLAGGAAAVGVAIAIFAWRRGLFSISAFAVLIGVALGGGLLTAFLARLPEPKPLSAPPLASFAQRADALLSRAMAPNSPLACIDAVAGDQVEAACEAVLFGRPESIAAAVSYVTAKVALFSQGQAEGRADDPALALLQQNLANDSYGIVAHVLATTAGCSTERCDALALVKDPSQIKANLRDGTFDRLVAKHAASWPEPGEHSPGVSDAGDTSPNTAAGGRRGKPVSSRFDFPSASSIPPVSIMVPENPGTAPSEENPGDTTKPVRVPRPAPSRPAAAPPASPVPGAAGGAPRDQ
ncbi:MAG: hypothetical protein R3D62_18610 [Xanthobacteraceae bacterium]